MSLLAALLLAASPVVTPAPLESRPVAPSAGPSETTVSVGLGQVRKDGALGAGLSLTHGNALEAPAPGKTRLVYRLQVHTTESGFPRWVEARLSVTEGGRADAGTGITAPEQSEGAFVAAVACVLRWLQPRDQRVFTFVGSTGEPSPMARPDAGTPARFSLGWGVEF